MKYKHSYLITIQFLGFRYHGWQKQTNVKTVHEMIDKTLSYVFDPTIRFKTLGAGRTDSRVSASQYAFQLFLNNRALEADFLDKLNSNFPPDIKALAVQEVNKEFNIIQSTKIKEYHYYFSFGEKAHPFTAPFLVGFFENLDIELMQQAAKLFEREHYFHKYCTKPSENTVFKRTVDLCEIVENTVLQANFFPKNSYVLKVKGKGFLRYQIRLMMGVLWELGRGTIDLEFVKASIKETNDRQYLRTIAPASGLQLVAVEFEL